MAPPMRKSTQLRGNSCKQGQREKLRLSQRPSTAVLNA